MEKIRAPIRHQIFIVDDHPVFSAGLKGLVLLEKHWDVCGMAATARDAIQKIEQLHPTLALVDLSLPGESGMELIKEIKTRVPLTAVLVISLHEDSLYAERALRAGAQGYVMKTEEPKTIINAIRQVLGGQIYVSSNISTRILKSLTTKKEFPTRIGQLSDREIEVLIMLGRGKGTTTVAQSLHLSPKTVEAHRANIKTKLNLNTAAELVCYAARWIESQQNFVT